MIAGMKGRAAIMIIAAIASGNVLADNGDNARCAFV